MNEKLYTLITENDPSNELDIYLKSLPNIKQILETVYQVNNEHISLLMLAACHGHDAVVQTILSHATDMERVVELSGRVSNSNEALILFATALWCACDRRHYTVARTLIEVAKARIDNGPNDSILFDAVIEQRLDTVQFLVENEFIHIDRTRQTNIPYHNSLTISATLGRTDIVAYLVGKGANIDLINEFDHQTALQYAASFGNFDVVKLLCTAGASTNVKNRQQDTPLRLAYNKTDFEIVDYLFDLTDEKLTFEELELMICLYFPPITQLIRDQALFSILVRLLKRVLQMRKEKRCLKSAGKPIIAYNYQQECQTIEEFDEIQHDYDRVYIEVLLIQERILTPMRKRSVYRSLSSYGNHLVKRGDFEFCLHLWEHTFYLYQSMGYETSLPCFLWAFCEMITQRVPIPSELFLRICRLTLEPSQQTKNDSCVKNAVYFVALASQVLEQPNLTKMERQLIMQWVNRICRCQRTTTQEETLLHLCVNRQTYFDISYRPYTIRQVLKFPSLKTVQLLIASGTQYIDLNAVEKVNGNTALHIVSQSDSDETIPIAKFLIGAGAHIDCLNKRNETPFDCATTFEMKWFLQSQGVPLRLKCICARHLANNQQLNYLFRWPLRTPLNTFIYLHGGIARDT
ncbi:unnamed protein product [Adineta ricciae]|uniref:Uncharacterized protein n=1 Tax=Adineta ricciae TaxID=249248 RepID=A0A814EQN4_ADIRI|nr:unnamed protein product [Adineta ricciae]CAF1252613.1 unnamed protein product [Adineta ricciae]